MNYLLTAATRPRVNSAYVLDASALLALIALETGWEKVADCLAHACISAVNLSEVAAKLAERGAPSDQIESRLAQYELDIIPFDEHIAYQAAFLRPTTRVLGLSFGDRACLATGMHMHTPILTAERIWRKLKLPIKVQLIR